MASGKLGKKEAAQADSGVDFIEALRAIEKEKGIDREVIFEAIEQSLVSACKKNYGANMDARVTIDRNTGKIDVYARKTVVEEVMDPSEETSLEAAREINSNLDIGDIAEYKVTPRDFGRISAQTAKQVVVQKLREAERGNILKEFEGRERTIVTGILSRRERRALIVQLGRAEMVLPPSEQTPGERYEFNSRIKALIVEVKDSPKGPVITVSRTHPDLARRLFEQEVPELADGTIEIMAVAREAGARTKIAVASNHKDVDPVGACVGSGGSRVNVVVNELSGEKIDVVCWDKNIKRFIANALSPSKAMAVVVDVDARHAKVVVPNHQLSLAIGREGQNARLAARLTGYRIDIKGEKEALESEFITQQDIADFAAGNLFVPEETVNPFAGLAVEYDEYDDDYDDYDDEYDDDYDYDEDYDSDDEYDDYYDDDDYDDEYDDYDDDYDDDEYDDYDDGYDDDEYDEPDKPDEKEGRGDGEKQPEA